MRCVLIASAIQRLLGSNSNANRFGSRVAEALMPDSGEAEDRQILERWGREFYRIRGEYEHGRLSRIQAQEYSLRASGWVRAASGIQSLISVLLILLGIYLRSQNPFE